MNALPDQPLAACARRYTLPKESWRPIDKTQQKIVHLSRLLTVTYLDASPSAINQEGS